MVRGQKEMLFYTGDVCFHDQTILRKARFEDVKADVLILETTRGNRAAPRDFSREAEVERIFEKWDLHAVHIGDVTNDGMLRVKERGIVVAEIPNRALTDDAPVYRRPMRTAQRLCRPVRRP